MRLPIFRLLICRLLIFLSLNNGSAPCKTSLKKLLVSLICLLLINAGMSCGQHATAAQPSLQSQFHFKQPYPQQATGISSVNCHQRVALTAVQHQQDSLSASNHTGPDHQCTLICALYISPAGLLQQGQRNSSLLAVSKSFYVTASPLQAWLLDLERPPNSSVNAVFYH